jgi:ABC-type transport system involved in Fe-S cluster assembly fused permease/ATPase subunit
MSEKSTGAEASVALKTLIFQMYQAGCTQGAIAAYVGKSKTDINQMLKPLQKAKES